MAGWERSEDGEACGRAGREKVVEREDKREGGSREKGAGRRGMHE